MSRAFSLLTLLRRRTVAAASVRKDQAGRAMAESLSNRAVEKRAFPQKPPEPRPVVKTRVFEKAPGLRRSWM